MYNNIITVYNPGSDEKTIGRKHLQGGKSDIFLPNQKMIETQFPPLDVVRRRTDQPLKKVNETLYINKYDLYVISGKNIS